MDLACIAPKITSLKFLKCSFFYAGVYCVQPLKQSKFVHTCILCKTCKVFLKEKIHDIPFVFTSLLITLRGSKITLLQVTTLLPAFTIKTGCARPP